MKKLILIISLPLSVTILVSCAKNYLIPDDVLAEEKGLLHEEASDYIWAEEDVIYISLNGSSISENTDKAFVSGSVLTINQAGTFSFSGTLTDGQIIVSTEDANPVRLILDGVDIYCSSSAPVYVQQAEKVIIYLPDSTTNNISDGNTYADEAKAAIYCKSDLTIFGEGVLNVEANYNDGISGSDGFLIKSGTINVNAKDDGIRGNDFLVIRDANIMIDAGDDGLKSNYEYGYILFESGVVNISAGNDAIHSDYNISINEGKFSIDAIDDGIHAEHDLEIENATITINSSLEGIEGGYITVNNGTIKVTATDDGFNATQGTEVMSDDGSQLTVNGGTITVEMSGNDVDAMDSNGDITINGGTINLYVPTNSGPSEGLDANGTITIGSDAFVYVNDEVYTDSGDDHGGAPGGH